MATSSILTPIHVTLVDDGFHLGFTDEEQREYKKKALNRGAHRLKEKVKETFVRKMPNADKPLTSKYNGKKWKGKLVDVVRQGTPTVTRSRGVTNVHILGSRKSGYGDFIGLFYNKGNFRSPDRMGKKKGVFQKGKETNIFYHKRGDLDAHMFLQEGSRGFKFQDTVREILKAQIEQLNRKKK